jgi:parvulin-like peptidyl-prolyl isomerase
MSRISTPWRCGVAAAMISLSTAAVIDRIAIVVGNSVITESEVLREVRLTEFLNRQPLDVGPAARRAAADRLVDQQLIRNEMITGNYPMPTDAEAVDMVRNFREENYPDEDSFRKALQKYGLTEDDLKQHFLWQLAVLRFTDLRFQTGLPGEPVESANRMTRGAPVPVPNDVDRQLEAWLKETRAGTKVQFKPGAFQ